MASLATLTPQPFGKRLIRDARPGQEGGLKLLPAPFRPMRGVMIM